MVLFNYIKEYSMGIYNKGYKWHIKQILIGLDQLCNTLIGGWADETLSSRCYRNRNKYWYAKVGVKILDLIFKPWDKEHCRESYESELKSMHLPCEFR